MAIVSLGLAPNSVFPFLLSLDSIAIWVYFGFVFAEKLRKIVITELSLLLNRKGTTREVFPTPESPVKRIGFLFYRSSSKTYLNFRVSIVGTMMSWYYAPLVN